MLLNYDAEELSLKAIFNSLMTVSVQDSIIK